MTIHSITWVKKATNAMFGFRQLHPFPSNSHRLSLSHASSRLPSVIAAFTLPFLFLLTDSKPTQGITGRESTLRDRSNDNLNASCSPLMFPPISSPFVLSLTGSAVWLSNNILLEHCRRYDHTPISSCLFALCFLVCLHHLLPPITTHRCPSLTTIHPRSYPIPHIAFQLY
jgi:hypothetical protein